MGRGDQPDPCLKIVLFLTTGHVTQACPCWAPHKRTKHRPTSRRAVYPSQFVPAKLLKASHVTHAVHSSHQEREAVHSGFKDLDARTPSALSPHFGDPHGSLRLLSELKPAWGRLMEVAQKGSWGVRRPVPARGQRLLRGPSTWHWENGAELAGVKTSFLLPPQAPLHAPTFAAFPV